MASKGTKTGGDLGTGTAIGVAAAATAAAAAAAGAYWLYGAKHAAKHRKMAKSFMLKARADVMDAVEKVKDIDKTAYLAIVDKVVAKYSAVAGVTADEVAQMTKDLKAAWTHINAIHVTAKGLKKVAPKAVQKVAKKAPAKKK
jgi:hypothetical protein